MKGLVRMSKVNNKLKVVAGVLVLTGVFAGMYMGANNNVPVEAAEGELVSEEVEEFFEEVENEAIFYYIDPETGDKFEGVGERPSDEEVYAMLNGIGEEVELFEPSTLTFMTDITVLDWTGTALEPQPYHISLEEAVGIVVETIDADLKGYVIEMNLYDLELDEGQFTDVWGANLRQQDEQGGQGGSDGLASVIINARTGEIIAVTFHR